MKTIELIKELAVLQAVIANCQREACELQTKQPLVVDHEKLLAMRAAMRKARVEFNDIL